MIDKKPDAELLSKIIEKANVKPPYVIEFGIGIGIGLVIGIGIGIFIYRNEKKRNKMENGDTGWLYAGSIFNNRR